MVSFSRSVWKKLHRAEKIYTGSARGARDNYEVWVMVMIKDILEDLSQSHGKGKKKQCYNKSHHCTDRFSLLPLSNTCMEKITRV